MDAQKLRRRFPTVADLRLRAMRRVPRFAFDFVDGGADNEESLRRNTAAFSAIEVIPRHCLDTKGVSTEVELFGHRYAAPFGVSPMGGGLMWPGAERWLAREAQRRNLPYVLSTPSATSIEDIAKIAPDVLWFQLYRFANDGHKIAYDLVRRADAAGAKVLVPTVDSAGRSKRVRDIRHGVKVPFTVTPSIAWQVATSPFWALALWKAGMPRSENLVPYVVGPATRDTTTALLQDPRSNGSHTWDELARLRDRWKRAFVVKGILHPGDAERAVAIGADGIIVSTHGGRLFDGSPASVDVLPGIVAAVGSRATVMIDSGIRGGLDVVRSLALGAKGTFTGRPFLYGMGALGEDGAAYVFDLFLEELRSAFQQSGASSVAQAAAATVRHPGAWKF